MLDGNLDATKAEHSQSNSTSAEDVNLDNPPPTPGRSNSSDDESSESSDDDNQEDVPESEREYKIKKIHNHGIYQDGRLMYWIQWKHYRYERHWTWESEEDLYKCVNQVVRYRAKYAHQRLPALSIPLRGGADSSNKIRKHNIDNWVDLDTIKSTVEHQLGLFSLGADLKLVVCHSDLLKRVPVKDSLIILLQDNHYYTLLWMPKQAKFFVSDGLNLCLTGEKLSTLQQILKITLIPIRVTKRIKIDYCAAASALCSLEYARIYKSKDYRLSAISFPRSMYDRLVSILHPEKSLAKPGRNDISKIRKTLTCDRCNLFSTTNGKGALHSHQRRGKCTR